MKAVILGKAGSIRVPNKNYRPFYNGCSLTDILLAKLTKVINKSDIYLSCEKGEFRNVADNWGINFIHREEKYTLVTTDNIEVVANVCKDVPYEDDLLWCTCTEPFFDEYDGVLDIWKNIDHKKYDSLNVIYPQKKFYLDQNHNPIGFGFGHWQKYSQFIPPTYMFSFATAILTRECIEKISYMVGKNPYWYDSYSQIVDIDTEEDWELAQKLYKIYMEKKDLICRKN